MSTLLCKNTVLKIYQEVIEDVISGVREAFLEDGVDEQVLQELKQTWETKLMSTKAVQDEAPEKKKLEHVASNGFPKVVNNPVQQTAPHQATPQQQLPQQLLQQQILDKLVPIQITLPPQPGSDGNQRVLTIQVPGSALHGNQLQKVLTGPVITATMGLPVNIASSLLQQHVNAAFNSQQQAAVATIVNKSVIQTDGPADQEEFDSDEACSSTQKKTSKETDGAGCLDAEDGAFIEVIFPKIRRRKDKAMKQKILSQTDGPNDTSDEDEDGSDDDNDDDDLDDDRDEDDHEMEDEGGDEEPLNSEDDVTDDDPTDLFDTDNIVVCQYDKIIRNRNRWKFYLKDGIMNLNAADYVFQKATGDAEW